MFIETADWVARELAGLELGAASRVADVGSSTLHYRTIEQPHVERQVIAPLRDRGCEVVHVDVKEADGVDIVHDICEPAERAVERIGGQNDLVITIGMLQTVPDLDAAVAGLVALTPPGAALLVESPEVFRKVSDPDDNGWRPDPDALIRTFTDVAGFDVLAAGSVEITEDRQYKRLASRSSKVPIGRSLWLPLPGGSERLRLRVPRLRWRDSVALLRRRSPATE